MKALLLTLTTLTIASVASAAEATIAPEATANLYSAVPEPSHAMLMLMGIVGLAARRRR